MILESQKAKLLNAKNVRRQELQEVAQLQDDIATEERQKKTKKKDERDAARKIIEMNEMEKVKRVHDQVKEKELAVKMQKDMDILLEGQERKRAEDKAAREARVQAIMDRMGDVVKKTDDVERAFDKKIIH